tara:strand:+ start:206 stop:307 length:102 start_codon:yes stop_codon:yes gene_type:complete
MKDDIIRDFERAISAYNDMLLNEHLREKYQEEE